jgi:hypothetical protein
MKRFIFLFFLNYFQCASAQNPDEVGCWISVNSNSAPIPASIRNSSDFKKARNSVVKISVEFLNNGIIQKATGSGVLFKSGNSADLNWYVLTADHNFDPNLVGDQIERVVVEYQYETVNSVYQLGYDHFESEENPETEALSAELVYRTDYKNNSLDPGNRAYDYAILKVTSPLPGDHAFCATAMISDYLPVGNYFTISHAGGFLKSVAINKSTIHSNTTSVQIYSENKILINTISNYSLPADFKDMYYSNLNAGLIMKGSSGGPLFYETNGQIYLIGLVSAGNIPPRPNGNFVVDDYCVKETTIQYVKLYNILIGKINASGVRIYEGLQSLDIDFAGLTLPFYCNELPPTCFDGVENGNESGVDCGAVCKIRCGTPLSIGDDPAPISDCEYHVYNFEPGNGCWKASDPVIASINVNRSENCLLGYEFSIPNVVGTSFVEETVISPTIIKYVFKLLNPNFGNNNYLTFAVSFALKKYTYQNSGVISEILEEKTTTITVYKTQSIDAGEDKIICPSQTITLGNLSTIYRPSSYFFWNPVGNSPVSLLSSTQVASPIFTAPPYPGVYTYQFNVLNNGCISTDAVTVTVGGCGCSAQALVAFGPVEQTFCPTATPAGTVLNAQVAGGVPPYTFRWATQSISEVSTQLNPRVAPFVPATYTLTVTDAYDCTTTLSIRVVPLATPTFPPLPALTSVCGTYNTPNQTLTFFAERIVGGNLCTTGGGTTSVQRSTVELFAEEEIRLGDGFETTFLTLGGAAGSFRASILPCSPVSGARLGLDTSVVVVSEDEPAALRGSVPPPATGSPNDVASELELVLVPNPARDATELRFSLPQSGSVSVRLVNVLGQVVGVPVGPVACGAGSHRVELPLVGLPAGTYTVVFDAGYATRQQQLVVVR